MKWLLALLGLALIVAAGVGLVASIDLLTTALGAVYVTCAAIALAAGLIILSLAAVTARIDALRAAIHRQGEIARRAAAEADLAPPVPAPALVVGAQAAPPVSAAAGPPPIPQTPKVEPAPPIAADAAPIESDAAAAPAAVTTLVGRYTSGGANYSIFSDGSIEAETDQGAFHFASMSDFKAYIASKRAANA